MRTIIVPRVPGPPLDLAMGGKVEPTYICERCGKLIPRERRELLPETTTCVGCSDVRAKTDRDLPPEVSGVIVGELNWEDA